MRKLGWAAVLGALGIGILLQIPGHERERMPAHDAGPAPPPDGRTAVLAVSGMT